MKVTFRNCKAAVALLTILTLLHHSRPAQAGWSGAMNGIGYGQATVNVRAYDTLSSKTKYLSTPNTNGPSVAMAVTTTGYYFRTGLPADSSSATEAKVNGFPGYIWQATTVGSDGDSTDNIELENRIKITAADCASLVMDSSASVNETNKSGIITVNAKGTAGTALWTRGIEYTGDPSLLPNDDPGTTNINETVEFLKTNVNSSLRWDVLMVGPLDLNTTNCNPLTVPFTFETDIENLFFITDGVAKSLPLEIECPNDIVVDCQQPVIYPETVLVGGCGNITVSFDPPAPAGGSFPAGSFPLGDTPVTVTATDKDGNTKSCTFKVTVTGAAFNGFYSPIGGTGGTCASPLRTAKLGNNLPVKFDVSCGGSSVTTGHPTMTIEKPRGDCGLELVTISEGKFQLVANAWHFNWETGSGQVTAGTYKLTATLQDGSKQFVWIKLK